MPASSTDSVSHLVGETLTATFAASGFGSGAHYGTTGSTCNLQQKLVSGSKRILMKKIDFASGSKQSSFQLDSLRAKYTPLNSSSATTINCFKNGNTIHTKKGEPQKHVDGLPVPKVVLFPPERVKLEWPNVRRIGAGLENMGNTCFLNSVLQCLTYTPPLINYIFSNEHSSMCKQNGFCMMCEIQRHIRRCLDLNGGVVRPYSVFHKLKEIARHLQYGRQEDAHEFLRYVVNAMQTSCLNGYSKLDKISRETTVVNQIFGGFLRSQVVCLRCKTHSNTYDPFLDISLDVKNVSSVPKAFERFVHPEMLDNDNAYSCSKCKQKVAAQKRFTIHRPSNVLTLQLKRFDIHRMFGKVTRHIDFPEKIDIRPYMSVKQGEAIMYQLYGVLVHQGMSSNSGHYYCYVKGSDKMWYTMNDNFVQQASLGRVLNAEAYLLFYIKQKLLGTNNVIGLKKPDLKPLPDHAAKHEAKRVTNGPTGEPARELGVPISRPTIIPTPTKMPPAPERKLSPLAGITQRDKISFGIKSHGVSEKVAYSQKPRIVMHIKKGKVSYSSVSDKQGTVTTATPQNVVNKKLVPYNDDDDESDTVPEKGAASANHKEQENEKKVAESKKSKAFEPVFDKRLNATLAVPGAYGSLDKEVSRTGHDGKSLKNMMSSDMSVSKAAQDDTLKLKHMMNERLTVQVDLPTTGSKVNATTRWDIQHQDAEAPSSVGSCSSTGSINSTTKWQVTPQRCQGPTNGPLSPLEVACVAGFTVKSRLDSVTDDLKSPSKNTTPPTNGQVAAPIVMATGDHLSPSSSSRSSHSSSLSTNTSSAACLQHAGSVESSSVLTASSSLPVTSASSSVASSSGSGRKHKHKKHKKKYKQEATEDEDDDDIPRKKRKKKKKKHKRDPSPASDGDASPDSTRHTGDASPTPELVWVEKTKETIEREHHKHHKVPIQSWDEHLQRVTSGGSASKHDSKKQSGKTHRAWDGTKTLNTDVISELQKNSIVGYGPQVNSWDGGRSQVDNDIFQERREKKRMWSDEYEEELDTGKTKKVRNKKHMDGTGDNNVNTFQKVQDYRNTVEHDRVNGTISFSNPERSFQQSPRKMLPDGHNRLESQHYRHSSLGSDHRDHLHGDRMDRPHGHNRNYGSKHKVYH